MKRITLGTTMTHWGFRELLWVLNEDCVGVERSWLRGDRPGDGCDMDQAGGSGHAKKKKNNTHKKKNPAGFEAYFGLWRMWE